MTLEHRMAHRRARVVSGLARIEREAPIVTHRGRRMAAWRVPGNRWASRWVVARARYVEAYRATLARLLPIH